MAAMFLVSVSLKLAIKLGKRNVTKIHADHWFPRITSVRNNVWPRDWISSMDVQIITKRSKPVAPYMYSPTS